MSEFKKFGAAVGLTFAAMAKMAKNVARGSRGRVI